MRTITVFMLIVFLFAITGCTPEPNQSKNQEALSGANELPPDNDEIVGTLPPPKEESCTNQAINPPDCDKFNSCLGDNSRSCTIVNGLGVQNRTCEKGVWSAWNNCQIISCNKEYRLEENVCIKITYACQGTIPSNATLCSGDNASLTANVSNSLVSTCGNNKCEYTCNSGYKLSNNQCGKITYSCQGSAPANATLCSGDNASLIANVSNSLVSTCGNNKCEYTCNSGYKLSNNQCEKITYSCQGSAPANATLCSSDNLNLTANVNKSLVSSCGTSKCEYTCNSGYKLLNNKCEINDFVLYINTCKSTDGKIVNCSVSKIKTFANIQNLKGDFSGDGKDDELLIVIHKNIEYWIVVDGQTLKPNFWTNTFLVGDKRIVADINEDGKVDVLTASGSGSNLVVNLALSTGSTFLKAKNLVTGTNQYSYSDISIKNPNRPSRITIKDHFWHYKTTIINQVRSYQLVKEDFIEGCFSKSKYSLALNEHATCILAKIYQGKKYRFAQLTDLHLSIRNGVGQPGYKPIDNTSGFGRYLITAKEQGVSFIVVTGDMFNHLNEMDLKYYYDHVYNYMKSTGIPVFQIPGNHEFFSPEKDGKFYPSGKAGWQSYYDGAWKSFLNLYFKYIGDPDMIFRFGLGEDKAQSARFILSNVGFQAKSVSLDTAYDNYIRDNRKNSHTIRSSYGWDPDRTYTIDQNEINEVKNELNSGSVQYTFVFTHMVISEHFLNACLNEEVTENNHTNETSYAAFRNVFNGFKNTIVFSGHAHGGSGTPQLSNCSACGCQRFPLFSDQTKTKIWNYTKANRFLVLTDVSPSRTKISHFYESGVVSTTEAL